MATADKQCPSFFPQEACSGNGVCDHNTGLCVCNSGYTAIGDFATQIGASCSINITAIKVLWALCLICSLGLFGITTKYLVTRFIFPSQVNTNKKFRWNDPLFIFPLNFWIESICGVVLAILKLVDPEKYSIALDPLASVLFGLFYLTGVHGICVFCYVLIKFLGGYARLMSNEAREYIRKEGEVLKFWSIITAILIVPTVAIPLVGIAFPGNDRAISSSLLVCFAFIATFLDGVVLRYLGIIAKQIEKHLDGSGQNQTTKNADILLTIKIKLNKARMVMTLLGPSSIVAFGVLAAWELLSRNTCYLWPLQLAATDVMFIPIVHSFMNQNDESDSRQLKSNTIHIDSNPVKSARLAPASPESSISPSPGMDIQVEGIKNTSDRVAPEDIEEGQT